MNKTRVLERLKAYGTVQNRKIYARHGMTGKFYGVSYANLGKLRKEIKTDQRLAEQLWGSRIKDAQVLATMVADPSAFKASLLDSWVEDVDCRGIAGAFSTVAAKTRFGKNRMQKWTRSKNTWAKVVGWYMVPDLTRMPGALTGAECEALLETIEDTIQGSGNWVRYAMNNALIGLGTWAPKLEKQAIAAARRIGKIEVDHGETGCKTPDAVTYIPKAAAHARKQATKHKRG